MSSDQVRIVERQLSATPVTDLRSLLTFVNRELKVFLGEVRGAINEYMRAPRVPIHAASPVTDTVVDPTERNPPKDGYLSYSSTDGKLYVRNGSSTHTAVVA